MHKSVQMGRNLRTILQKYNIIQVNQLLLSLTVLEVYCGYPGYIRNGYLLGTKYYYQDRIIFRCYDGYVLVGNTTIECQEDGRWYPDKPQCTGSENS